MKYRLLHFVAVLSIYTIFLSNSFAGGMQPLPGLSKAVEDVYSIYSGEGAIVVADKEFEVRKNYYQVQSKMQKLKILNEVKGHFEKAASKAEESFDSGEEDVSQSAITKLKLGLAGTQSDIIELESEIKLARLSLALIFKSDYSPQRELLNAEIEPDTFNFTSYDAWFKEAGLISDTSSMKSEDSFNIEVKLKKTFIKAVEAREMLNLARDNRKITRALLVSEVANYDFGIGEPADLFEALIIYTRVLSGYYDTVYNLNLAVADLNRVKTLWTGKT